MMDVVITVREGTQYLGRSGLVGVPCGKVRQDSPNNRKGQYMNWPGQRRMVPSVAGLMRAAVGRGNLSYLGFYGSCV